MRKPKQFEIHLELYRCYIVVSYAETNEEIERLYRDSGYKCPDLDHPFDAMTDLLEDRNQAIILKKVKNEATLLGNISHECTHAALNLFSGIGEDKLKTNQFNEPFCYLVGYLVETICQKIFEK
jgi:hypothetical protein